jgi:hypothetical protein
MKMTTPLALPDSMRVAKLDGTPLEIEIADMTMADLIRVVLPLRNLIEWLERENFRTLRDGVEAGKARQVGSKVDDTDESCPQCGEIDWRRTPGITAGGIPFDIICGTCGLPCWWDLRKARGQRK